jgi:hypothetical protein
MLKNATKKQTSYKKKLYSSILIRIPKITLDSDSPTQVQGLDNSSEQNSIYTSITAILLITTQYTKAPQILNIIFQWNQNIEMPKKRQK